MSAPSELHEERVRLLEDLASMVGCTTDLAAYYNLRPDVCRLHFGGRSIFIADAKSSERPDDAATCRRLVRYALAIRLWKGAGLQVAFGVCHAPDSTSRWQDTLRHSLLATGEDADRVTYAELDDHNAISMLVLRNGHATSKSMR